MTSAFAVNWWAVALRGVAAVVFGLLVWLLPPGVALGGLLTAFGAFALLDGLLALVAGGWAAVHHQRWWPALLEAAAGLGVAATTWVAPAATVVGVVYLLAAWAIVTGVLKLAAAVHLGRHVAGAWWLGLAGIASVLLACALFVAPGMGLLVLVWLIGAYALIRGAALLTLALRLRRHHHRHRHGPPVTGTNPT